MLAAQAQGQRWTNGKRCASALERAARLRVEEPLVPGDQLLLLLCLRAPTQGLGALAEVRTRLRLGRARAVLSTHAPPRSQLHVPVLSARKLTRRARRHGAAPGSARRARRSAGPCWGAPRPCRGRAPCSGDPRSSSPPLPLPAGLRRQTARVLQPAVSAALSRSSTPQRSSQLAVR